MPSESHTNRLIHETSPYLLQHAHNPVDWYPWGPEALEEACRNDKPILLSIGYSACHWCHVMAHESFEDKATAEVMNRLFVNIKVDREERPDLDRVYQLAHQLLTRRGGGWPLTVFLSPRDLMPFFAGTYFPKEPRYNMPPFVTVLRRVADFYASHKDDLERNKQELRRLLGTLERGGGMTSVPDRELLERARRELEANFDAIHGGFGGAPKFPHAPELEFLLRFASVDPKAPAMVEITLSKMAQGGIYDHLGGGFARYAVDERWEIPHFEKMLYDNGLLLGLYARMFVRTKAAANAQVVMETATWAVHEMQSPEGGYYASLDADSEGGEGRFYLWDRKEVQEILNPDEYAAFSAYYGLMAAPNFEGRWHLRVARCLDEVAILLQKRPEEVESLLATARARLFAVRERRVRPGRDEKIIASWNGLMIAGMTVAGRLLQREDFIRSAERAFDFVRGTMDVEGRLQSVYKDGRARFDAYLDDHAFLLDAALELLQSRWRSQDLLWAMDLADRLLARFEDKDSGGFFFTASDHEPLIQRPKPWMDESMPSGNGVALRALSRLAHLTGELRYADAAERGLKAARASMERYLSAHGALLNAALEWLDPPATVIVSGEEETFVKWRTGIASALPDALVYCIPTHAKDLPPALAARSASPKGPLAYLCHGGICAPAVDSIEALRAQWQARA